MENLPPPSPLRWKLSSMVPDCQSALTNSTSSPEAKENAQSKKLEIPGLPKVDLSQMPGHDEQKLAMEKELHQSLLGCYRGTIPLSHELLTSLEFVIRQCLAPYAKISYMRMYLDDLRNSAYFLIVESIEDYTPTRGGLAGWLFFTARNAMALCFRECCGISEHHSKQYSLIRKAIEKLEKQSNCEPTPREIADYLGIKKESTIVETINLVKALASAEEIDESNTPSCRSDGTGDLVAELDKLISSILSDDEMEILSLKFFDGFTPHKIAESLTLISKDSTKGEKQNAIKQVKNEIDEILNKLAKHPGIQKLYKDYYE